MFRHSPRLRACLRARLRPRLRPPFFCRLRARLRPRLRPLTFFVAYGHGFGHGFGLLFFLLPTGSASATASASYFFVAYGHGFGHGFGHVFGSMFCCSKYINSLHDLLPMCSLHLAQSSSFVFFRFLPRCRCFVLSWRCFKFS